MTALASFLLIGFAAVVSAAAIASAESDSRPDGRRMMIDAQYNLAIGLRR
jgi:hypothetical protein